MPKLSTLVLAAALAGGAPAAAAVLGPEAGACAPGAAGASMLVKVDGFKQRSGDLRVQVYAKADDFLVKGRKLKRIDLGVTRAGPMEVCVALPGPGDYAVAVRHDVDGSGKSGWNDGGGFSRNPQLSLLSLKPRYRDVAVAVAHAARPVEVVLNYRHGLTIGPVDARARS